jgi:hypothetical protein
VFAACRIQNGQSRQCINSRAFCQCDSLHFEHPLAARLASCSHHRARKSLQRRADGSSMRALDSTTETETHHNDGAVSVACDQSQIESLSVGQGSADIHSATSCKAKKRLCLQSYKSPQVLCERRPERLWYFAEVRGGKCEVCEVWRGGCQLDFQKEGSEDESSRPWQRYLYTLPVRPNKYKYLCTRQEQRRSFWTTWDQRKILASKNRIITATAGIMAA